MSNKLIKNIFILSIINIVSIFIYKDNLYNFFVSEDLMQVWESNLEYILQQLFPNKVAGYRPIMYIWWGLGYLLFDYNPFAFRWFIVTLHSVNAIIVYRIVHLLAKNHLVGVMSGLFYLSMPIHSNVINWLSAASNQVTCAFFYLIAILFYLAKVSGKANNFRNNKVIDILCISAMILAMATNEVALTIIFALFGINLSFKFTSYRSFFYVLKLTLKDIRIFLVSWLVFIIWRALAVHGIGGYGASVHLRAGDFLFQTSELIVRMLLLPWSEHSLFSTLIDNVFNNYIIFIASFLAVFVLLWRGHIGLIILASSLLPILNIPAYHRLYVPAAGLAIAIGSTLGAVLRLPHKWMRMVLSVITICIFIFNFIYQYHYLSIRNQEWSRASAITSTVVMQTVSLVPAPPSGSVFYYYGLPRNLGNGVQVFNWGLRQAVQAAYNNRSLKAFRVKKTTNPRYSLEHSLDRVLTQKSLGTNIYLFIFDINEMKLRLSSEDEFVRVVNTTTLGPEY